MSCVMFNSAAPAGARPLMATRRGAAAQEQKRSPTRTTARDPNVRSFTVGIFDNNLKSIQRENALLESEHTIYAPLYFPK